ncbi:adenylate/guanylate cyclase domain-containing protein [Salisaeta longa]|uniref:adenylate/guanylate cyclase domain-containing protein n=1 Tax=Salisaeta longa TaxID=503170 RepID=UPI0003B6CB57|nr:adenylate/guanylate cyclase domain-containing protein [Salisaeta longa]
MSSSPPAAASSTAHATVLFADLCGSTQLYETLGDAAAQARIQELLNAMKTITRQHNGTVVKTIGDEVLSTFQRPFDAVDAALVMRKELDHAIYVGLHYGPVVQAEDDVYGDCVNTAARLVEWAKPQQIITTQAVLRQLPAGLQAPPHRVLPETRLKGKADGLEPVELLANENQTGLTVIQRSAPTATPALKLSMGETTVTIHGPFTLGRSTRNDLQVQDTRVSRHHATIEPKGRSFILKDMSSNGTYVRLDGGVPIFVHRDTLPLQSAGVISLGRPFSDSTRTISFAQP